MNDIDDEPPCAVIALILCGICILIFLLVRDDLNTERIEKLEKQVQAQRP